MHAGIKSHTAFCQIQRQQPLYVDGAGRPLSWRHFPRCIDMKGYYIHIKDKGRIVGNFCLVDPKGTVHLYHESNTNHSNREVLLRLLLFWHAPLGVRSAISRHQPPQRAVLSQIDCFVQCKVVCSQVSLDGVQARDRGTPWWYLPVLWRGSR